MVLQKIQVDLTAQNGFVDGELLTGRGLLGLFYDVLTRHDEPVATALHKNDYANPFTITPIFSPLGHLEQVQIVSLSADYGDVIIAAWQTAVAQNHLLHWGKQSFQAKQLICGEKVHLGAFATSEPKRIVGLDFCSPTTFKTGPQTLPLPLSHNVFRRPFYLWNELTHNQPMLQISNTWFDWCERQLFIYSHDICTKQALIHHKQASMIGFVGQVWFRANKGTPVQLSTLHALARFADFCGVGAKTSMGMGHVAFLAGVDEL